MKVSTNSTKKLIFWLLMLFPLVLTGLVATVFMSALLVTSNLEQGKRPENIWAKLVSKAIVVPSYSESRNNYQQLADCVKLDDRLIYVPTNTECRLINREFDTTLIHKDGIRQNQSAEPTQNPNLSILVLGDSHAMGWGVDGHETFSAVIERSISGVEVHNTGVSSYGLPRELMLLNEHIRTYDYDIIVLQYCSNDIGESQEYIDKGLLSPDYTIPVQSGYNHQELERRYLIRLVVNSIKRTLGIPWWAVRKVNSLLFTIDEGQYTARVLEKLYDPTISPPMIIFPINGFANSTRHEYHYLMHAMSQLDQAYTQKITILDPLGELTNAERSKMFFNFDGHMTADGHSYIGAELSDAICSILNSRTQDLCL
ncbi:SGNH/GDSL hydrolase family protein [Nitrospira defluvii]|nr:SGNH/GDSL hydrolase family protein [Nitrospira defluvii]